MSYPRSFSQIELLVVTDDDITVNGGDCDNIAVHQAIYDEITRLRHEYVSSYDALSAIVKDNGDRITVLEE